MNEIPDIIDRWVNRARAIRIAHIDNNPEPNPKAVRLFNMIATAALHLGHKYNQRVTEAHSKQLDNYPKGGYEHQD